MTHSKVGHLGTYSDLSDDSMDWEEGIKPVLEKSSVKEPCSTHGPSETKTLDRDLQSPNAKKHILALAVALGELANEDNCTKCTVEKVSKLITLQALDIKAANQTKGWTKEDKKIRKVEFKILCQGVKKDLKVLWKGK
ncbi:hypothetical protein N7468_005504 [Penicillium chermesinum]|uniref:Uncharacterized protein n=1 Tax=Penicillium chermesinum TaxID=63820 RepID=A0A9W9NZC7_9EURO|nr:uncharacterized protein N7468_005504 [Penicillium chermesinum]KAJ5232548.1 hypothetical protein N7468_005504 [Penicillium chermesinum]KAJ6172205.1 hypothetical protein N7470_001272 [Penicillium chermesinum]